MRLFGTSGIRGVFGRELTVDFALKLGQCAGVFYGEGAYICVAHDNRRGAESLASAIAAGLTASGCDVLYLGVCPTPAVLWCVKAYDASGAIVVTGSHMPAERLGILFFKSDTSELSRDEEREFEKLYRDRAWRHVEWEKAGSIERGDAKDIWIDSVLSYVDTDRIADMRVVIDTAGGACSGGLLKEVLESADLYVYTVNDTPDPFFKLRDPFPRPDNLQLLSRVVRDVAADVGVGTDADGDRALFVDESGSVHWGDVSGAVFIRQLMRQGIKEFVVTANTSMMIEEIVRREGGSVHYCDVGAPDIAAKMKELDVYFGLEETGKYLWADAIYYGDVALATLRMLEIIAESNRPLSELIHGLPKYHLAKISIPCPDELKPRVVELLGEKIKQLKPEPERVITFRSGGYRLQWEDCWLLMRASGTEPVFRVYAEARTEEKMRQLLELGKSMVEEVIQRASGARR